jgi:voltage-gated potassium channel
VYVTLAARQLNPNLAIVTRVDDMDAVDKARRAGASRLVTPFGAGAIRMAQALLHPESSDFVEQVVARHNTDLELQDVTVGPRAFAWHGSLRDLDVRGRAKVLVVAIRRPDGVLHSMPDPEERVGAGDVLVVVGKPRDVARFKDQVA